MSKYIRCARALIVAPTAIAVFAIGACSGDKKADTLAQDSTLGRDMQLANRDSVAQPQLNDVPATTTAAPAAAKDPGVADREPTTCAFTEPPRSSRSLSR